VATITSASTATAGLVAVSTGFVNPRQEFDPSPAKTIYKPVGAYIFPSLTEELVWRAALIPVQSPNTYSIAAAVLVIHVLSHPVAAATVWPRGRGLFCDKRFLVLASIVLTGATASYLCTGCVWAAAFAHWAPLMLWRDVFGGEARLQHLLPASERSNETQAPRQDED
jgi:predicted Abi (CAAX) family protease